MVYKFQCIPILCFGSTMSPKCLHTELLVPGWWWNLEENSGWRKQVMGCLQRGHETHPSLSLSGLLQRSASPLPQKQHSPEPSDHGLRPLKPWAKINISSFNFLFSFCHSNEKLTYQYLYFFSCSAPWLPQFLRDLFSLFLQIINWKFFLFS